MPRFAPVTRIVTDGSLIACLLVVSVATVIGLASKQLDAITASSVFLRRDVNGVLAYFMDLCFLSVIRVFEDFSHASLQALV